MRVTSLLSRYDHRAESSSDHLPLAAVVRSALSATSSYMRTDTRDFALAPKPACDGLPLTLKALKGTAKYYQVSSPDFSTSAGTVSREVPSDHRTPHVNLSFKTAKSLE